MLAKFYPNKDMSKLVNNLMNTFDEINELEKEKLKVEQRLSLLDNQLGGLSSDKRKDLLENNIRNERDQLSFKLREFDKQISIYQ